MKKFISRIWIFFGVVSLLLLANFLFNSYQLKKAPNLHGAKTIIIGDSRIMTAINPDLIPNSVNIAQNSESYIITYYKLKYLLRHNKGVERVILGFSYPSFSAYLDHIFKNDMATLDVLNRIYPIMSIRDFHGLEVDEQKYYQVLFKNLCAYPHTNHHQYMGGFVKLQPGIERANLQSTIMRHYFDKDSNNIGISVCARQYLDSIITLTRDNHTELVLVNVPLHKDYLAKIPPNFIDYYNNAKDYYEQAGIKILDYSHIPLDNTYFKDYNHLSAEGADWVTQKIKEDLHL